jgi:competence protein ComEC
VISAGEGNAFAHPSPTLRSRLGTIHTLRTDLQGSITFDTDGVRLWVEAERRD